MFKTKSIVAFLALTLTAGAFQPAAQACIQNVSERALFDVNVPGKQVIESQTGDMVRLALTLPLIPRNLGSYFEAQFDKQQLQLVAEVSLPADLGEKLPMGVMGRVFYFRVIGTGSSKIVLTAKDRDGQFGLGMVSQEVVSKLRPTFRCN